MNGSFEKLTRWAGLIRDLGLIIGVPILITIGISLYQQQIEVLKARNELLRETQYDRALSLIKSQKELFEIDRNNLENKINELTKSRGTKDREIKALKERLSQINKEIDTLNQSEKIIGKTLKQNKLRHRVLISTKVDHAPRKIGVSLDEYSPQLAPNVQGNSRLNIIRACDLSLIDLQTDYIDIFQIFQLVYFLDTQCQDSYLLLTVF